MANLGDIEIKELPLKMKLELSQLQQTALIELFEVDFTELTGKNGVKGRKYRFYAGANELKTPIIWQGNKYEPYAIQADGFELSGQGTASRPQLTISNLEGLATILAENFNQGLGAVVIRRQVYAKFLDSANFATDNANADPTQERISYFIIEQLSQLNEQAGVFTLAIPSETDNAVINGRTCLTICQWCYRSTECGYKGTSYFTEQDQATTDKTLDSCSATLAGCKLRNNTANFGGFVAVNKLG